MRHSTHIYGSIEARFWPKVKKTDGCWLWTGAKLPKGYGKINDGSGRAVSAHRVAWLLAYGEYPALPVLHLCDTPSCVRKDHLFLGTLAENNEDMRQKGRKHTKLTASAVFSIRQGIQEGKSATALARIWNVSEGLIRHIKHGRAWRHLR